MFTGLVKQLLQLTCCLSSFESEIRIAMVEAEIREELMTHFENRMREMEAGFTRRLQDEVRM